MAFLCSIAASRNDCRTFRAPEPRIDMHAITRELEPMLRRTDTGAAPDLEALQRWMIDSLRPATESLLQWSESERDFLDRLLDEGVIEASLLHADRTVQQRVLAQPMLLWKAQNVRQYRAGN